jgi:uncharacterized protein (TIGR01777 family)
LTNSVLITGASGLIGKHLTRHLLQKGCRVAHLGRSEGKGTVQTFTWDPYKGKMDSGVLEGKDTVIHLAGANVAAKRWSSSHKREVLESRVKPTAFLRAKLKEISPGVKTVVVASAIGIYGYNLSDEWYTEDSPLGKDFLADVVKQWEGEADEITLLGIRVVKIRTGIVMTPEGGALREMMRPMGWGIGAPLASGRQWVSWIHRDDLCGIFASAVEQGHWSGTYNAAAPNPVTNEELTKALAKAMHRKIILPAVPAPVLRLLLGEMAELVIHGSRVASHKVQKAGYRFQYPDIQETLRQLISR